MASTVIIRNNLYNYDIVAMVYDERWGLFKKLFEVEKVRVSTHFFNQSISCGIAEWGKKCKFEFQIQRHEIVFDYL